MSASTGGPGPRPSQVDRPNPPAYLHNMSARPRTPVTCRVVPLRDRWVSFKVGADVVLDRADRRRLDSRWDSLGFRGAALMHTVDPALSEVWSAGSGLAVCADVDLTLNVVLRTRGDLLLGDMRLLDDPAALGRTWLATDDLRLVSAARVDR